MKKLLYITILFFFSACSVQKYLPEGERLYKGATIKVTKAPDVKQRNKTLTSLMKTAVSPRPNKFFLGQPWKVWWWYKIGEPKREKGLKAFLRNRLGEPPVLSSRVKVESTAENIQSLMDNNGYFKTTVQGDTNNFSYFTKAVYTAQVKAQYSIKDITWVTDSSAIMKAIQRLRGRSLLRKGNAYNLDNIKAERERLDLRLKTRGYYYFNPDYLMSYVDSTVGDKKVNLYLNIKKDVPKDARTAFRINRITVYPNYSLTSETLDTSAVGATMYEGIYIKDSLKKYKPSLFARSITYDTGSLYNSRSQNASLNRLISLGTFKFVKNRFEKDANGKDSNLLNVYYYLTPAPKKSLQGQVDGFTKDNNFLGSQVSINFLNRNAFRGGEQLTIKGFAGFETSFGDSLKGNNNFRLGGNVGIRLPRYEIPFFDIRENNFYQPNTSISLGYEWYRKNLFYSRNAFTANYEFTWKKDVRTQFRLAPISLAYIRATGVTDSFYKQVAVNPSLLLNIYDEVTLGTTFNFTYTPRPRAKNKLLYSLGIDLSGNVAGLLTKNKGYRQSMIFGAPFAQFVKLDLGTNFTRRLTQKGVEWANRLELGIGIPYANSKLLPFAKQYTIGGASSIRGFSTRSLGPGTYKPSAEDQRFFQIIGGDFRLLANTELRTPFSKLLSGAVFVDAGNIWTKDTIVFGPKSKLTKDWFKEIAVAGGVGLRVDLSFLLLRFDLGIPFRKPYLPDGDRWVFNQIDFASRAWRRENLVFNIAIGLPF
ncbi:MAG: hypothetical protein EOO06_07920 [Chitinophagaceae bacterium]|nr:MAG: hypothetical protein EOO06_07920 [Chitinophagaceae bacterium]